MVSNPLSRGMIPASAVFQTNCLSGLRERVCGRARADVARALRGSPPISGIFVRRAAGYGTKISATLECSSPERKSLRIHADELFSPPPNFRRAVPLFSSAWQTVCQRISRAGQPLHACQPLRREIRVSQWKIRSSAVRSFRTSACARTARHASSWSIPLPLVDHADHPFGPPSQHFHSNIELAPPARRSAIFFEASLPSRQKAGRSDHSFAPAESCFATVLAASIVPSHLIAQL